jgi:SPASM domain peptide maturase of grasp-with-spasm system
MRSEPAFRLFACCIPVRGARRSTLCDLQRQSYRLIPNALYEILTDHVGKTLDELEAVYGDGSRTVLEEYFRFLLDEEFGFWCDEPDAFPPLDLRWDRPERVSNAIVDVDAGSSHDYAALVRQLDALGCAALQYRFFVPVSEAHLEAALAPTRASRLRSVDLLLHDDAAWTEAELAELCVRNTRLAQVLVHGARAARTVQTRGGGPTIVFSTDRVDSSAHCGFVHPRYFAITLEAFTEARAHNSCLNRKVSVDARGLIRNCPAFPRTYGHASRTPLAEVVALPEFRQAWEVTKDQVETCRDCEFRYVCTDCRALLRDPDNPLSKPLHCGYDPYTATWSAPALADDDT